MTYVYNSLASEIKRKPTAEEKAIVNKQYELQEKWYKKYNKVLHENKELIKMPIMKKVWDIYLRELKEYNRLFNIYMGYCY